MEERNKKSYTSFELLINKVYNTHYTYARGVDLYELKIKYKTKKKLSHKQVAYWADLSVINDTKKIFYTEIDWTVRCLLSTVQAHIGHTLSF